MIISHISPIGIFAQSIALSKRCGKCSKPVSISSKVGDLCPYCGVRWGYENNNTTTNIRSNSLPTLVYNNHSPIAKPSNSQTKRSSIKEKSPNPFNSYTREQTEKWLEEKLKRYAKKRISCPDRDVSFFNVNCKTYDEYEFIIDGTYLIVKYNYDNKYDEILYLPLYDFSYVRGKSYESEISVSNSTFKAGQSDYRNTKKLVSYITIGFRNDGEDSLVNKIELAFTHLKQFYQRPSDSELPDVSFKSNATNPSLEDTRNWILSKLNSYIDDSFDVYSSCCSFKIINPSFTFSGFNLVIQYYDITSRIVTVTIPVCECYIGEITATNSNDFSGCNYRFFSPKENLVINDWQGTRNIDFINLKINFKKEDDLFTRMQKAFKNVKSYCPNTTKQKEIF